MVKNMPAKTGDTRDVGSGRSPEVENDDPLPWTEEPGRLQSVHGIAESDMIEQLSIDTHSHHTSVPGACMSEQCSLTRP